MPKFEIGHKDSITGNIYYTGYTFWATNREQAKIRYVKMSGYVGNTNNIRVNEVD